MKAVIFDMDGVLVNTEPLHFRCWKAIFARDGIDLDYDVYKQCIGSTMTYLLELIRINYGKTFPGDDASETDTRSPPVHFRISRSDHHLQILFPIVAAARHILRML